jgi:hypothetical protein
VGAETGACGVRQVGAASHGDRVREPNGGPNFFEKLYSTCASPVVPHPSTGHAHGCLASEIGPELALNGTLIQNESLFSHKVWATERSST